MEGFSSGRRRNVDNFYVTGFFVFPTPHLRHSSNKLVFSCL